MRTNRAGILMSGGLDSTSIAAVACDSPQARAGRFKLHAVSLSYDSLMHDEERQYSTIAAKHLGISIEHFDAADGALFEGCGAPEARTAEPHEGAANPVFRRCYAALGIMLRYFLPGRAAIWGSCPRSQAIWVPDWDASSGAVPSTLPLTEADIRAWDSASGGNGDVASAIRPISSRTGSRRISSPAFRFGIAGVKSLRRRRPITRIVLKPTQRSLSHIFSGYSKRKSRVLRGSLSKGDIRILTCG